MTIIAATGHRPGRLGGYGYDVQTRLLDLARRHLLGGWQPERVIVGMAQGWDWAMARAAIALEIPVTAAVPFHGQEMLWPAHVQREYRGLLDECDEVVVTSNAPGGFEPYKMQLRNQWMVDNCTDVVALWDGGQGGTCNCVRYAKRVCRPVVNLWDAWVVQSN